MPARKTKVNLQTAKLYQHLNKVPAAQQAALEAIKKVTDPLTPRDTGELINSGEVSNGQITYSAPYAARQHEDLSYNHPVGGPKYLERGIKAGRDEALEAIAKVLKL